MVLYLKRQQFLSQYIGLIYSKTQYISFGFVLCVLDGLMKY